MWQGFSSRSTESSREHCRSRGRFRSIRACARSLSRSQAIRAFRARLTIAGAQPLKLALTLQPLDARAPAGAAAGAAATTAAGEPKPAEHSHGLSTPFWVSAISTGVFAGAAVTFGVVTLNRNQKLDDELNRFPTDAAAVESARQSVKTGALLTDVFIGASIVGAAASVYFALTSGSSEEAPPKAARKQRLQLGASGSELILSGRF